ncbi:hypothetical protein HOP54_08790 [Halomonas daqingensis]|uniref:hypothetical protein n=1 Tax=Billgrantia desiderata TaxID=52021 RepID=UPI001F35EFDF|nr:hypothetical protein [Halomonas desiderata]MCE8028784.1 hypothetical protein [Halomonas desiderata]
MHALTINDAACAYLLKMPRPYQRTVALERCTSHLVEAHGITLERAGLAALQALAELETLNQAAYIDAEASTAHVVVVRRPGRNALAFSVADLLRLHAQERSTPIPPATSQH